MSLVHTPETTKYVKPGPHNDGYCRDSSVIKAYTETK